MSSAADVSQYGEYGDCNMDLIDVGLVVEVKDDHNNFIVGCGWFDRGQHLESNRSHVSPSQRSYCEGSEIDGDSIGNCDKTLENISVLNDRVVRFSELKTPKRMDYHGFSQEIKSYHVVLNQELGEGCNAYRVVASLTRTNSFKFLKNTTLIMHPLLPNRTDGTINCFLPRRQSSSGLVYIISRNASNPHQVYIRSKSVTVVSADSHSDIHAPTTSNFSSSQVLDENCNHSEGFRKSDELIRIKNAQSAHNLYSDVTFESKGLPNVSFEFAVADHNYPKETLRLLSPHSAFVEVTNMHNENAQEVVEQVIEDLQMQLAAADLYKQGTLKQELKQCPSCGSRSNSFSCCDFCRTTIAHVTQVFSKAVPPSSMSYSESKSARQCKRKIEDTFAEPCPTKRPMLRSQVISTKTNQRCVSSSVVRRSISEAYPQCSSIESASRAAAGENSERNSPDTYGHENVNRLSCVAFYFGNYHISWTDRKPQFNENVVTIISDSVRFSMLSAITLTKRSVIIPKMCVTAVEVVNFVEANGQKFSSLYIKLLKPLAANIIKVLEIPSADNRCGQDAGETTVRLVTENLNLEQLEYIRQVFGVKFKCETSAVNEQLILKVDSSLPEVENSSKETVIFPLITYDIAISPSDIATLLPKRFLNDIMLDFWLAHFKERLLEGEGGKIHVFNSYFYTSLTKKISLNPPNFSKPGTAAEKRHQRVRKWTKDVDIFSKDFVIVPINESMHWYVAVICFPGLLGPCWMDDGSKIEGWHNVVEVNDRNMFAPPPGMTQVQVQKPSKTSRKKSFIESTVEDYFQCNPYNPGLVRNEAPTDAKEDLLLSEYYLSDSEELENVKIFEVDDDLSSMKEEECEEVQNYAKQNHSSRSDFRIKQPCILVFNSLPTFPRSRVLNTLREYLEHEYKKKIGTNGSRIFNKYTMPGFEPNVPQQKNFYDCGLYLLQYVEHFLKYPLTSFLLPLPHSTRSWFTEVDAKRQQIFEVIKELVRLKEPNAVKLLPDFPTNVSDAIVPCVNNKKEDMCVDCDISIIDANTKRDGQEGAKAD